MLSPGNIFGAYRIERELGRGGMGAVYEATHVGLQKRVAIKVMLGAATADAMMVERFLREGEVAARIQHEHIVNVTDVGSIDGLPFLVMEYLDGESLASLVEREGPLPTQRLVDLMLPIIAALDAAHAVGVVHRDLKPDNIFLARSRRNDVVPKLVDFGISRMDPIRDESARRITGSAVLMGTPCYMSPEQARGARLVDPRSDQFSLGVVLFECATGQNPFLRESLFEIMSAILTEDIPAPSVTHAAVDPRLDAIILRAMSRDPSARFADMRTLGAALLPFASPAVSAHWARDLTPTTDVSRATLGAAPTVRPPPPPAAPTLEDGSPPSAAPPRAVRSGSRPAVIALVVALPLGAAGLWFAMAAPPPPATMARVARATPRPIAAVPATAPAPTIVPVPVAVVAVPSTVTADAATPPGSSRDPRAARVRPRSPGHGTARTPEGPASAAPATPGDPPEWQIRTNF